MEKYLRGTIIIKENTYITKAFKITKGTISKRINNNIIEIYKNNQTILLEYIDNISIYSYIAEELTIGEWIDLDIDLLKKQTQTQNIHLELLLINDPIIKVSRFIYYKYIEKQVLCFYLEMTLKELSEYLKIEKRQLSKIITHLITINIISKQNKLIIIQNLNKLINISYSKDI